MIHSSKSVLRPAQRAFAVLACLAAGGCITTSFPKTPANGGPAWREIVTEHFAVDTDLEPDEGDALVEQLENLRGVMGKLVFGGEARLAPRMRVLALRHEEYGHFDRVAAGSFINWTLFQPVLVITPGGDWQTFASDIRKHELAHYVSSLYVDMRLQPRWFAEGTADYLETIRYDATTGAVEIGHHPRDFEYLQYATQATFDELWAWDKEEPYDALTARLYQTSWAIVHYLYDQRAADLLDYERALARGQDARKAWDAIFPDLAGPSLDETIRKYIYKRDYKITKGNVPWAKVQSASRMLDEADVLGLRAALYMAVQAHGKRTADESKALALENVKASLQRDETSFWAHQVNLFYFDTVPSSVDVAKRTLEKQKENWLAWLWYAEVLRRAKTSTDGERIALSKALELAPENPIALTQLAWVEARSANWKAALDTASRAIRSPPVGTDAMIVLAAALSRSNRCDEARTIEDAVQKRLKNKVSKNTAEIFAENRKVCASEHASSASARP